MITSYLYDLIQNISANFITELIIGILLAIFILSIALALTGKGEKFRALTPNLLTSLGIFGTFLGVIIGLVSFDPHQIDQSITQLLDGLKTAFITSLVGMLLAILFKAFSTMPFRNRNEDTSSEKDTNRSVDAILREQTIYLEKLYQGIVGHGEVTVAELLEHNRQSLDTVSERISSQQSQLEAIRRALAGDEESSLSGQFKLFRSDLFDRWRETTSWMQSNEELMRKQLETGNANRNAIESLQRAISGDEESSLAAQIKFFRADAADAARDAKQSIAQLNERIQTVIKISSEQQENFKDFSVELWRQMEVFAEMLSKSATETVIMALRDVIEDFNNNLTEQFGENFKALDASVQKLVEWQQNYKEQLVEMMKQYQMGVTAITETEASVVHISDETKAIPKAIGQLSEILEVNHHQLNELENHLEAFAAVRDKATEAVPQIQEQITSMTAAMKEGSMQMSESLAEGSSSMTKAFNESAEKMHTTVVDAAERFGKSASEQMSNMETAVQTGTSEMVRSVSESSQKLYSSIENGASVFSDNVQKINSNLSDMTSVMERQNETVSEHLKLMSQKLQQNANEIQETVSHGIKALSDEFAQVNARVRESGEQFEKNNILVQQQLSESVEKMRSRLESTMESVFEAQAREVNKAVDGLSASFQKAVEKTGDGVNAQLSVIDQAMSAEIERVMNEMGRALATITGQFVEDYGKLVVAMQTLVRTVDRVRR